MVDTEGTLTLPFAVEGTRFERNGTVVRQRTLEQYRRLRVGRRRRQL